MKFINKIKQKIAFGLILALSLAGIGFSKPVKAETLPTIWFSTTQNGSSVPYLNVGDTAYLNYDFAGTYSNYTIKLQLSFNDTVKEYEVYSNMPSNSISYTFEEEGEYSALVIISDGDETVRKSALLEVTSGVPRIISQPQSTSSDLYKEVTFSVESDLENVEYQWYVSKTKKGSGEEISGASKKDLIITAENVIPSVCGNYYFCIITSEEFCIRSNSARLLINGVIPSAEPTESPEPEITPSSNPIATPIITPISSTNTPKPSVNPIGTITPVVTVVPTKAPIITTNHPIITANPYINPNSNTVPTVSPSVETVSTPSSSTAPFNIIVKYNVTKNANTIKWENNVASTYQVCRSTKENGTYYILSKKAKGTFTDKKISPNKTYYYRIYNYVNGAVTNESLTKKIKTTANPALKGYLAYKSGRAAILRWKFNSVKTVVVQVNTGNGYKKIGSVAGKKSLCKVKIPNGFSSVKFRIRGFNKVNKKKYYSKYSKGITIKL